MVRGVFRPFSPLDIHREVVHVFKAESRTVAVRAGSE
jgi:hypothetical protein